MANSTQGLRSCGHMRLFRIDHHGSYVDTDYCQLCEVERVTRERSEAEKLAESLQNRWASRPLSEQDAKTRIGDLLREHWLTGVECNEGRGTDTANCFCTHWRSTEQPNVGQAVERWIEHVLEQL